jgi:hypothetical protein
MSLLVRSAKLRLGFVSLSPNAEILKYGSIYFQVTMHFLLLLLIILTGCSAKSPETFKSKARCIKCELLQTAQNVEDLDQLMRVLPTFSRLFNQLVEVMIQARKWQIKHRTSWDLSEEDRYLSFELAQEFARLYQIPTARAFIEKCQQPALERLDAFEKKQLKLKSSTPNQKL